MPSAPRQNRPLECNARDSSRATQCATRVRRKNGTTVVVRCRTPKVSLGHSSRLSPRVNCAEAGATCGFSRSSLFPASRRSSRSRDGIDPCSGVAREERPPRVNGSRARLRADWKPIQSVKRIQIERIYFQREVSTAQISFFETLVSRPSLSRVVSAIFEKIEKPRTVVCSFESARLPSDHRIRAAWQREHLQVA